MKLLGNPKRYKRGLWLFPPDGICFSIAFPSSPSLFSCLSLLILVVRLILSGEPEQ